MPAGHSTRLLENPRRRSSGRLKRAVGLAFAIAVCALTTLIAAPAEAGPATINATVPASVAAQNIRLNRFSTSIDFSPSLEPRYVGFTTCIVHAGPGG